MNPFDLKSALLAKHAQHVVLIHFPIALFLVAVMFDFVARLLRKPALTVVAYYNLIVAAFMSVPVLGTGVLAWRWQLQAAPLQGLLLQHMVLGFLSAVLIWIAWWFHRRAAGKPETQVPAYCLVLESVGACVVALTAHLGGFLSGVSLSG